MDWDLPKSTAEKLTVGDELSTLSIAELSERIEKLEAEIARTRTMMIEKQRHTAAADALFGKAGD